jgi:hypothetical protein
MVNRMISIYRYHFAVAHSAFQGDALTAFYRTSLIFLQSSLGNVRLLKIFEMVLLCCLFVELTAVNSTALPGEYLILRTSEGYLFSLTFSVFFRVWIPLTIVLYFGSGSSFSIVFI